MEIKFKKENKYLVLKVEDITKYLDVYQVRRLYNICDTIHDGRVKDGKRPNDYVVVNEDEPYAEKVWTLIQKQWEKEHGGKE